MYRIRLLVRGLRHLLRLIERFLHIAPGLLEILRIRNTVKLCLEDLRRHAPRVGVPGFWVLRLEDGDAARHRQHQAGPPILQLLLGGEGVGDNGLGGSVGIGAGHG